jgi:hypothetical protein
LNGDEANKEAKNDEARKISRATLLRFEVSDHLKPLRIGPFGFAKFVEIAGHAQSLNVNR